MGLAVEDNSVNQLYPKSLSWSILSGFVGENMSVYPYHPCIPFYFMVIFVSVKEQSAWDSV